MTERVTSGYAALQTDSGNVPTDGPYVVHGVAIGENDVTIGGSGKQTLWPRETLKEAAEGLQGQPLATDTDHTADNPKAQTPVEAIAGEVTWSGYKPGVGVLYEAEIDDEDLAKKVNNGRLEVSPLVSRELEALEGDTAEYKATEITRWRDLALVANGAAPSNEITVGSNPMKAEALHATIEALQTDLTPPESVQEHAQEVLDWRDDEDKDVEGMTDTGWDRAEQLASGGELSVDDIQEISAWFARHGEEEYELNEDDMDPWEDNGRVAIKGWGGPPMRGWSMDRREELVEAGELEALAEALKEAAGVEFDGTTTGKLDESEIPNEGYEPHYLYPSDTKTDSSYPVVDADGNLRRGNVDAAWGLGARGDVSEERHDERLMELAQEFDNPPEWAMDDAEAMADIADVSEDTLVTWDSSGDRNAYGMVVDVREEGDEPLDGEIDGDQTINPPAALIEVHRPDGDEWEATDTMVGHTLNTDTLEVVESLPDPESLSKHEENMASVPDSMKFDNPGEAVSKAQDMGFDGSGDEVIHTHGEGDDTIFMPGPSHEDLMDMLQSDDGPEESMAQSSVAGDSKETMTDISDTEKAILEAAEGIEEPVEALNEYAATEGPTVVAQSEYESLKENVTEVRDVLSEALAEKTDLKDSTIDALGFEALCDEFRGEDGDLQVEALRQEPETAGVEDSGTEALGEDADVDKAEALYADMQEFGVDHEDTICEALGVSDFDDAKEVLN